MKNIPRQLILACSLLFTIMICTPLSNCSGQFGIKAGMISPYGDIGQYFKKAPIVEIFGINEHRDGQFRVRMGLFYTKFTSRLDTFPIYAIADDPNRPNVKVVPGYLVNNKFRMYGINADFSVRLFEAGNFSAYAGAGLQLAIAHVESVKSIETVIDETDKSDNKAGGFRICASAQYKLSDQVSLFGDWFYNFTKDVSQTTRYTHAVISLGVNYNFNSDE